MSATISAFYTFAARTTIRSSEVNANFQAFMGDLVPIDPSLTSAANLAYGLGSSEHRWSDSYIKSIYFGGSTTSWQIKDATSSVGNLQFLLNGAVVAEFDSNGIVLTFDDLSPGSNKGDVLIHDGSGTVALPVGTDGYVLTADSSATSGVSWKSPSTGGTGEHEVLLRTANGYGTTNTKIRRYTTTEKNTGTSITYLDDISLGASLTINTSGVYAVTYVDQLSASTEIGVSVNSTQLTTNIQSISMTAIAVVGRSVGANVPLANACMLWLRQGDVVRPHTTGSGSGTATNTELFRIVRVL